MWSFLQTTLRAGIRSKNVHAILVLGILLVGAAYLAAAFSLRQPMTVALDVGFSGLRFALVLLGLFWVLDLFGKEIERKTIVFVLAYPVPRRYYLFGRYFGVVLLLLIAAVAMGLLLMLAVFFGKAGYEQEHAVLLGTAYWSAVLALWLDAAVVTAFAMLLASVSTVTILPVALGGIFALAAGALGPVLEFLQQGADGDVHLAERFRPLVTAIHWLVPDLSRLDWRQWPMYGVAPDLPTMLGALVMGVAYATTLLLIAARVFSRRELF